MPAVQVRALPQLRRKLSHLSITNPDDKMLGGVVSGLAAPIGGWDVTMLRLVLVIIMIFRIQAPDTRLSFAG